MKNKKLADLNFKSLLDYGGQPEVKHKYDTPLQCAGFCHKCEDQGLVDQTEFKLGQMSHGCDSSDFEEFLGPLPGPPSTTGKFIEDPIMFVLESPGSSYHNAAETTCDKYTKMPPRYHYYWTPYAKEWPTDYNELPDRWGSYFAYLMREFGLRNVYITNLIKCGKTPVNKDEKNSFQPYGTFRNKDDSDRKILDQCYKEFFSTELKEFSPKLIIVFGDAAHRGLRSLGVTADYTVQCLYHPSSRLSLEKKYAKNNQLMLEALKKAL